MFHVSRFIFQSLCFMKRKRLPKSLRKYIRREKARIRRENFDLKKREKLIEELHQKIFKNHENPRNI